MYVSAADAFPFRATGKHAGPGLVKASVVVSIHLLHADSDELFLIATLHGNAI